MSVTSGGGMQPASIQRYPTGALPLHIELDNRYRIVHLAGKGGFGAVYEATDERFQGQRTVAIKELSDSTLNAADKVKAHQDFRQEAQLLVKLQHPNLPNVSDFFERAGKAYLVMDFVQGKTLEKLLEDAQAPLDEDRVLNWALQISNVLHYLHTQQPPIIFRDLKPSNVMVTPNDQVKLIDFGIARVFKAAATKDTTSLGSRGFAPLEQYGMGQTDHRSDLYAFGATLYNLLTNSTPPDALTRRINPAFFEKPRQLNPAISQATEDIILHAMQEQPDQRFQSALEMQQAILANSSAPPTPSTAHASATAGGQVSQKPPPTSRRVFLIGGIILAAGAGIYALGSSQNWFSRLAALPTLPIDFIYSTEKEKWLQEAIAAFQGSEAAVLNGKRIEIRALTSGSLNMTDRITQGEFKPIAWTPASSLEINRFQDQWQEKHAGRSIIEDTDTRSIVQSPFVFAIWEDRARLLLQKYQKIDWNSVHDALRTVNGWVDIGGPAAWTHVKFGHTRPDESNSGLLTIILMAYAFFKKQRNLSINDVKDKGFVLFFQDFEDAVTAFGHSSGTYLSNEVFLKGTSGYDIVATYENLVLTAQDEIKQRVGQLWRPFYPALNILSDHPFAILRGDWASAEQLAAAKAFRTFLLGETAQRLALKYGLRPVHQKVRITDNSANNLFLSSPIKNDIQSNFQSVVYPLKTVVQDLLNLWLDKYSGAQTGNG
jgi:serine/threonine protein kinase